MTKLRWMLRWMLLWHCACLIPLIRKRLQVLYKQKAAQVVAQGSGKVQIWGYWTGVPYVHQRAKPLPIPESPYKTRWIGGRYPGVSQGAS